MTGYDSDPRVRRVHDHLFIVRGDDEYGIEEVRHGEWVTGPMIGGASYRSAGLRNRQEAEAWAERTTVGPFPSSDAAIASLIGPPQ